MISTWGWTTLGLLTLFFVIWPFYFGFFNGAGLHGVQQMIFEKTFLYGVMLAIPTLILSALQLFKNKELEFRHLIAFAGMVIPLLYWLSSFDAVSPYLSRFSTFNAIAWYGFLAIGLFISEQAKLIRLFTHVYFGIGSIVVIWSFGYLFGNVFKMDALQFVEGLRVTSVFTYPNAYAAFLLTLLLVNLVQLISGNKFRIVQLSYGFMLLPITVSLILTLSRGAMIMLPMIALVTLVLIRVHKQIHLMLLFLFSTVISLVIQSKLVSIGTDVFERNQRSISNQLKIEITGLFESSSLTGWVIITAASLTMMSIVVVYLKYAAPIIERKLSKWSQKRFSNLWIPLIFVMLLIIGIFSFQAGILNPIIPEQIQTRLEGITLYTHSVLERLTMYRNGLEIWKQYPILGGGGGVWDASYEQFQSYPYSSAQTHSYPLQVLLETGVIGFLIIGGLILYIIGNYIVRFSRGKDFDQSAEFVFLLIAMSVLLHSIIDFEMSYLFFGALVYFCLGVLAGKRTDRIKYSISLKLQTRVRRVIGGLWVVTAFILLVGVSSSVSANNKLYLSSKQADGQKSFSVIVETLNEGLKKNAGHPLLLHQISAYYISAYDQTEEEEYLVAAEKYIDRLNKVEPNYSMLPLLNYSFWSKKGESERAVSILEKATERYPFELNYYEMAMSQSYQMWTEFQTANSADKLKIEEDRMASIYNAAQERVTELKDVPEEIFYNRKFIITNKLRLPLGQVNYANGQYEKVVELLKEGINEPLTESVNRETVRYYIASLRAIGQDDSEMYQNLIHADPEEERRLISMLQN